MNETRSQMDVAQSELDIYLSQHNTAVSQLNQAKEALQGTADTLRDRRAAIKELKVKVPKCEQELKKVCMRAQGFIFYEHCEVGSPYDEKVEVKYFDCAPNFR